MSTNIHVSGLSCFCTDDKLHQAFLPFGAVLLAQVLKDECGYALGLGIVHMARCEDVKRVFNAHQHFEISGSHVDPWEPSELKAHQGEPILAHGILAARAAKLGHDTKPRNGRNRIQRLAVPRPRLIKTPAPSAPIAPSLSASRVN